jgi:uncharacterized protein
MFKNRKILKDIWENIDNDFVVLLNGARQVGKTTLMKMIVEKLENEKNVQPDQILWFDLEKSDDLDVWSSQTFALSRLPKDKQKKYYLFIDEFQRSSEIGSILKVIHDHYPHIKTIITGSASWYLNIDESMAGRKRVINIWPLSFSEYVQWSENEKHASLIESALNNIAETPKGIIDLINNEFKLFASYGGYPKVVLSFGEESKAKLLQEIINSYLLRDIKIYNYAINSLEVKKLLTILASLSGNILSLDSLSINSGIGRTALVNRLELLQNTFIVQLTYPYFTNKIKETTKAPKIYFVDNGLRNSLLNNFSVPAQTTEFGHLAENAIVMELFKNNNSLENVYFWRTVRKQEVDIIKKKENNLIPIEIKSGNVQNIPEGLKSFIRQYNPPKAFVLNWSIIQDINYQNCIVHFRPLWFADKI